MLQNLCEFSADYPSLLRTLKDPTQLRLYEKVVQFPFSTPTTEEKTEEELARITERRREQGRKLQELAAKAREEKVRAAYILLSLSKFSSALQLQQKESDLQYLTTLRGRREEESKKEWAVSFYSTTSSSQPSAQCCGRLHSARRVSTTTPLSIAQSRS